MSIQSSRRFVQLFVVLVVGGLAGCAPPVIHTSPDTFNVPADAARHLRSDTNVALKNAYPAETKVKIFTMGESGWFADMKQYTDTAVTMLGREMQKKGVAIDPKSPKTVTLKVYDVSASPGWVIHSSLTLEAVYGDGTKSTVRTENSSPSDAWRSVDGSLMFAVTRLLGDDQFVAYVNK
jgi:hypothetical protein